MGRSVKEVTAAAPATIANVGPGFDCLGIAIQKLKDRVTATRISGTRVEIGELWGDVAGVPQEAHRNTASVAVRALLRKIGTNYGISLSIQKGVPPGSGLGSSAASAVAALTAVNHLLNLKLKPRQLLPFAMEGERIASGTAHADNVAPALLGGVVLVRTTDHDDVVTIKPPKGIWLVVIHPHFFLLTRDSRRVLPAQVPFQKAMQQVANAASLLTGFCLGDVKLIGRSMEDIIVEPARQKLIPHFSTLRRTVLEAGALGYTIAGGGPSSFAIFSSEGKAKRCAQLLEAKIQSLRPKATVFVTSLSSRGAQVL